MTAYVAGERSDALRLELAAVEVGIAGLVGAIPGTAILAAGGANGTGTGHIRSTGAGDVLSWKAPGSATYGAGITVASDGVYVLEDGEDLDSFVRVQVSTAFLLAPNEAAVLMRDVYNALGPDDVPEAEATAGAVEDTAYTVQSYSLTDAQAVTAWLDPSAVDLEISDDGIVFVSPTTEGAGLDLGTVSALGSAALHTRRTIGALAPFDPEILNLIHLSWEGL